MQTWLEKIQTHKKPLLVLAGLVFIVVLWLGNTVRNLIHNKTEMQKLTHQSAQLDAEYEQLLKTRALLEAQDPALIEKIARTEYGLAKPGEVEFRFSTK